MMTLGSKHYWSRQCYNKDTACYVDRPITCSCYQSYPTIDQTIDMTYMNTSTWESLYYTWSIMSTIMIKYHWLHYTLLMTGLFQIITDNQRHCWLTFQYQQRKEIRWGMHDILYNCWVWKWCIVKDVGDMHYPMGLDIDISHDTPCHGGFIHVGCFCEYTFRRFDVIYERKLCPFWYSVIYRHMGDKVILTLCTCLPTFHADKLCKCKSATRAQSLLWMMAMS